jgi:hypothetical protein
MKKKRRTNIVADLEAASLREQQRAQDWLMETFNVPRPALIQTIRSKNLSTGLAVSEWIDNARRFKATEIAIEFDGNAVSCSDNGKGTSEPSLLLGYACSTAEDGQVDISRFGVGSKDGQLRFGLKTIVQTVCKGVYREQTLDWREAEKRWPRRDANLRELPLDRAPKFIQNGGLILTVTDLDRKYRFGGWFDLLCQEITWRYWLAIEAGLKITLIDAKEGARKLLEANPTELGIKNFGKSERGLAGERGFEMRCTDSKHYNPRIGGINIFYDGRNIRRLLKLNKVAVPQSMLVMVNLDKTWRTEFTPNKQDIQADSLEELSNALYPMLKELIEIMRSEQEDIAITEVDLQIREMLDNVIVLDEKTAGKFKAGKLIGVGRGRGGGGGGGGGGKDPTTKPSPCDGGQNDKKELPQNALGISVVPDKTPNPFVAYRYELSTDETSGRPVFRVYVNRDDFPLIGSAYLEPYKLNVLIGLAACAFAEWATAQVKDNPEGGDLAKLISSLNAKGALINITVESDECWTDFRAKIASFILNCFKLKQEERDRLAAHVEAETMAS